MKKNISISVIVPFFNTVKNFGCKDALVRCLDSLARQKNEELEFIFVDNNSQDESRKIIENYIVKDSRFKIFSEGSTGASNARNMGLKKSTGDYVTFVDSDDYIGDNYFAEALTHINKSQPDILVGDFTVCINGTTYNTYRTKALTKEKSLKKLFPYIECSVNIFYKRSIIKNNKLKQNSNIRVGEDNLFNAHFMEHCKTIKVLESKSYFYQVYKGSSSNVKSDKFLDFIDAYDKILMIYQRKYGKINKDFTKYIVAKRKDFHCMIDNTDTFDERLISLLNKYKINTKKLKNLIYYKDISVVVQGAVDPVKTQICLQSIRKHLPEATIILSTWEGANIDTLSSLFDKVVFSKDPGYTYYLKEKIGKLNNINRQIVSTKAGLESVKTKYVLKLRTDLYLTDNKFLNFFDVYSNYTNDLRVVEKRMLACTKYTRNPSNKRDPYPMHASDIIFFGLYQDIYTLFNIDLMTDKDLHFFELNNLKVEHGLLPRYLPEQYIWTKFLNYKNLEHITSVSEENIKDTNMSFINNLVLLSPVQFNVKSNKKGLFSYNAYSCYTHYNWLKIYQKHVDSSLKISIFNLFKHLSVVIWEYMFKFLEFIFKYKQTDKKILIKILKIPVFKYTTKSKNNIN